MANSKPRRVKLSSADAANLAQRSRDKTKSDGGANQRFHSTKMARDPKFIRWLEDLDDKVATFNKLELDYMPHSSVHKEGS